MNNNHVENFPEVFDSLIYRYMKESNSENEGLLTYFDEDFYSPCYSKIGKEKQVFKVDDFEQNELVSWRPILRGDHDNLENLQTALELPIPLAMQQLFCRYYSLDINASAEYGNLTILQALNQSDFERLQKNLIAHVLMKRRLKQAETLFFALTDEEDFVLSVDIATQAVMLEEVGKEPQKKIADSLTSFFQTLNPQPKLVTL